MDVGRDSRSTMASISRLDHHRHLHGDLARTDDCMVMRQTGWICIIVYGKDVCICQSGMASHSGEARSVQTSRRNLGRFWTLGNVASLEGWMQIGAIHYDPLAVLGRGCEGTIVYR